jgi:lipid II:glycine glycyltransferase (peptidoglycan interpeptide bridge formation enzyme)
MIVTFLSLQKEGTFSLCSSSWGFLIDYKEEHEVPYAASTLGRMLKSQAKLTGRMSPQ